MRHILHVLREELGLGVVNYRLWLIRLLVGMLPFSAAVRIRTALYRLGGVSIGRAAMIMGPLRLWGRSQLTIGQRTMINTPCAICLDAPVTIGSHVLIGHDVVIASGDHEIGPHAHRGGRLIPRPVVIEDGVWIGAGALILPGVTIGAGAIVGAGALVTKSVAPDTVVGGVPARVIRTLADNA